MKRFVICTRRFPSKKTLKTGKKHRSFDIVVGNIYTFQQSFVSWEYVETARVCVFSLNQGNFPILVRFYVRA